MSRGGDVAAASSVKWRRWQLPRYFGLKEPPPSLLLLLLLLSTINNQQQQQQQQQQQHILASSLSDTHACALL
uniref:Uncharacterized protein n=1 Tax=Vespula pensylvanica TaxID=30213 RepID=A0A834P4J6_VESPE|nr:hypothetical protein H0235_007351 [Vespula pensylvanica]